MIFLHVYGSCHSLLKISWKSSQGLGLSRLVMQLVWPWPSIKHSWLSSYNCSCPIPTTDMPLQVAPTCKFIDGHNGTQLVPSTIRSSGATTTGTAEHSVRLSTRRMAPGVRSNSRTRSSFNVAESVSLPIAPDARSSVSAAETAINCWISAGE